MLKGEISGDFRVGNSDGLLWERKKRPNARYHLMGVTRLHHPRFLSWVSREASS